VFGKRAPDNTNLLALGQMLNAKGWRSAVPTDRTTESPGALMRSAPYAVFRDVEECYEYAARGASLTHPHPVGCLPAAFFAALLHGLLRDMPWEESYARAMTLLESHLDSDEIRRPLDSALNEPTLKPNIAKLGGGWTAISVLSIAL